MPNHIMIDPMPFLTSIFGKGLVKDLNDTDAYTEEICQHCHGIGLRVLDNSYGLKEEISKGTVRFPYRVQTIGNCPHCGGSGLVKRCRHCGNLLSLYSLKCTCETQQAIERAEREKKEKERLDSLRVATPEEVRENKMFYSDQYPYNEGYFEDFSDFFEAWGENENEPRPEYCFGTDEIRFSIDADSIVEAACEDLYEEAYDRVSNIDDLQKSIDAWAEKNGPGSAYAYHTRYKIRIPWELDN